MKRNYFLNLLLVLIIALSCCTPYHNSQYFKGLDRNASINHKVDNFSPTVVQIGDVLALNVRSLNPEGSAIFNNSEDASGASGSTSSKGSGGGTPANGYLVDQKGEIELPLVHHIKVLGMTIDEVENTLTKAITPFLKEPIVTVHIVNFKITIIGDVGGPSTISVGADHISIPQALSQVGDLTATGKRENVLLIREINGERKYVNIDLTSPTLFDSPYYYLRNNDILYVEVGRGKFAQFSPVKQNLPFFLSIFSLLIFTFEAYKRYQ